MISSRSYYQATVDRRFYEGKLTRRERDEAIDQNRAGKRMGNSVPTVRVNLPGEIQGS